MLLQLLNLSFFSFSHRLFLETYLPESALPTKVIIASPANLCLAGYLNTAKTVNTTLLPIFLVCAMAMTFLGVYFLLKTLSTTFKPDYSAYTFQW